MKKKRKSHIPIRLNVMFSIITLLFVLLAYRLIDLQFFQKTYYANAITNRQAIKTQTDMTRGQIFDRNGKLLVGNQSFKTIDYTRYDNNVSNMLQLADKLVEFVSFQTGDVSEQLLREYFVARHSSDINKRLTNNEKFLTGSQLLRAQSEKVTAEELATLDEREKQKAFLYSKMYNTGFLATTTLKSKDVNNQEIARVSESLSHLNGISIGTNWERTYPEGMVLRDILGGVSSEQAGLPEQRQNAYLAQGYNRNSRVGTSYLEQQYDTALRGTPKIVETKLDTNGAILDSTTLYDGKSGANLHLGIDIELQKKVEAVLTNFLRSVPDSPAAFLESAFAVVQDVKTGDILAMSGKQYGYDKENDKLVKSTIEDNNIGVFSSTFAMGSVIKVATVVAGYRYGIISETNNVILDTPMYFSADVAVSSLFNRRGAYQLSDIDALVRSSNVYMAKLALGIGGQTYVPGQPLNIKEDTLTKLRNVFSEFGLGVYTGIDLPNENRGYSPMNAPYFAAIMESFGQYDTYTPLQISQYMATIANGGSRFAPRLVTAIRQNEQLNVLGSIATDMPPRLLNRVAMEPGHLNRIKTGLYGVNHYQLGTAQESFSGFWLPVSGKTGTAEALYNGRVTARNGEYIINTTYSSFAPSNNPEIAVTVIIPNLHARIEYPHYTAHEVARRIYNVYYNNQ